MAMQDVSSYAHCALGSSTPTDAPNHVQLQIEQLDLEGEWTSLSESHTYPVEASTVGTCSLVPNANHSVCAHASQSRSAAHVIEFHPLHHDEQAAHSQLRLAIQPVRGDGELRSTQGHTSRTGCTPCDCESRVWR
eukprot:scaffold1123_cov347-Prasinococcus_capsulatus_cf.AAC.8